MLIITNNDRIDVDLSYISTTVDNFKINRNVTKTKVTKVSLETDFRASGVIQKAMVVIESQYDISVTVFIIGDVTRASYLALPNHVIGKEYIVATFCKNGECECSITSVQPHTHIYLNRKPTMDLYVIKDGSSGRYNRLEPPYEIIIDTQEDEFETNYVYSKSDLSGMSITSNYPVVVLCGKISSENVRIRTWTLEQLLPTSEFGMTFYAYPRMRTEESLLKFVAIYNCTRIQIGKFEFVLDAREVQVRSWNLIGDKKIQSDAPISVMQLFVSEKAKGEGLIVVPAVNQYLDSYMFSRNIHYKFKLCVGVLAVVDFKIRNYTLNVLQTKTKGFFVPQGKDGVTLDLESPFLGPYLAYILRKDKLSSTRTDITTSPMGFNFTQHYQVCS